MSFIIPTDCPSISLPAPTDLLTCHSTQYCGIECCASIDIKVTRLFLKTWLVVDPCNNFELSVGLGNWMFNKTLLDLDWGVRKELTIADALKIT